jgi:hypothetical protein
MVLVLPVLPLREIGTRYAETWFIIPQYLMAAAFISTWMFRAAA